MVPSHLFPLRASMHWAVISRGRHPLRRVNLSTRSRTWLAMESLPEQVFRSSDHALNGIEFRVDSVNLIVDGVETFRLCAGRVPIVLVPCRAACFAHGTGARVH